MQWLMYHFRLLHTLAPATNDHTSALRVSISVAAPSLVLLASGYPELIIYAVCGALTGVYGRSEHHQLRLRHQAQAAVLLVAGVGVGVFLSVNCLHSWWLVGVEAFVAAAGSIYSGRVKLKPDGPFFGILALGACASKYRQRFRGSRLCSSARSPPLFPSLSALVDPGPRLAARSSSKHSSFEGGSEEKQYLSRRDVTLWLWVGPEPPVSSAAAAARTGPWLRQQFHRPALIYQVVFIGAFTVSWVLALV
jgi:hypothetical protein